jgi:hypothetical protein
MKKKILTLQTHFNYEQFFDFEEFKAQAFEKLKAGGLSLGLLLTR